MVEKGWEFCKPFFDYRLHLPRKLSSDLMSSKIASWRLRAFSGIVFSASSFIRLDQVCGRNRFELASGPTPAKISSIDPAN